MTAVDERTIITEPGVYELDDETYHGDPVPGGSLSCSGAKKLLPPSCPAIFDWERRNPPGPKAHFDLGHAAHKLALGVGPEIVVIPGERWDTKDAKAAVAEAREAGQVPVKQDTRDELDAMVAALKAHPIALDLFSQGQAEASLFFTDGPTGIMRRSRLDWLPDKHDGRMIIPDYKTAASSDPVKFAKSAGDFGYDMQHAWYADAVAALDLAGDDAAFVFVVQAKTAPYVVTICQLDVVAVKIGRYRNRRAIETYAECVASGRWPGYSDDVELVSLPPWIERQYEGLV